ncbi:MAG: M20/M25/M40 family metallo-hydrolase [Planctomycetota bacterium]|nr:M20/M25/M40 family metallo-hydrolase [Planctomycetota bacterium]MDA1114243.1 M20/M25/M40 family metallo-hydrolase [Planctomycetota bacterium]
MLSILALSLSAPLFGFCPAQTQEPLPAGNAARIEADIRRLADFGTRNTLSDTKSKTRGIGAARSWLRDELESISEEYHDGRLEVRLQHFEIKPGRRIPKAIDLANVVAVLPGTDPDRLVVLSGHYDSMPSSPTDGESDAPGANDDASGTAAVLEAARMLGGLKPRATIVFLAVAGEEQGLYGSTRQAEWWKEEGKHVEAMFTMDIVGGVVGSSGKQEPYRLRVFSEGVPTAGQKIIGSDNDAPSRQLARYIKRTAAMSLPEFELTLIFRQDRFLRGGDHRPFNDLGWAAIRLTEPHENYHWQHQDVREEDGIAYGDVPDNVDFAYTGRVATSVASAVRELSLAPAAPQNVQVDISELTPHTTLRWQPNTEKDLAGYAILLRRTDEALWTDRIEVPEGHEITLEGFSKDNFLFAVEAVDKNGNRSLAVYPYPSR